MCDHYFDENLASGIFVLYANATKYHFFLRFLADYAT